MMDKDRGAVKVGGYTVTAADIPESMRDVAEKIGVPALIELMQVVGGQYVYIPQLQSAVRMARNRAILREYTGCNVAEIARNHGVSKWLVRQVVSQEPECS